MKHLYFRLNRIIHRRLLGYSKKPLTSYPYISGDTFRNMAEMIYDSRTNTIVPSQVKYGTIIFVASPKTKEFFEKIHPQITNPYILITHNGDDLIDIQMASFIDEKIIKWYAMSVTISHPGIIPIPAGLENLSYYNNGITKLFDKYRKNKSVKKNRILFGFSISTNPTERQPAYDFLINYPQADKIEGTLNASQYIKKLNNYKFVASPPGNAIESHRMWEAMYLGVIPIVKRSFMMEYFCHLGLPIWLIDNWQELAGLTETDLANKYQEIMSNAKNDALWFDHWLKQINSYKTI